MWKTHRWLFISLIILTICRWIMAGTIELSEDEAYYHLWSEHPAFSYYSKGPGVAVAMGISSTIFGDNAFGIRFFSPLLALGTSLLIYQLARSIFDSNTAAWSTVLLNVLPIFNAGAILLTIDPLSIFFWIAAMLGLWRALHRAQTSIAWWAVTGLMIGCGFLCKYTNAVQLISIILLLALVRRWRPLFRKPGPYVLLASFLVCTIPVIIWNAQNQWITVTHLIERGKLDEGGGADFGNFASFLGLQCGVYSPIIFIGIIAALFLGIKRLRLDYGETFLTIFAAPLIVMYFVLSFKEAEPNWTAPGMLAAGILAIHYFHLQTWTNRTKSWIRGVGLGLAIASTLIGINMDLIRKMGAPIPYAMDPLERVKGWEEVARAVEQVTRNAAPELGGEVFLITDRYQLSAILNQYMSDDAPIIRPDKSYPKAFIPESSIILNQFSFWPRYDAIAGAREGEPGYSPFLGKNAIFITNDQRTSTTSVLRKSFAHTQPLSAVEIRRFGLTLRDVRMFICYDYRGLNL